MTHSRYIRSSRSLPDATACRRSRLLAASTRTSDADFLIAADAREAAGLENAQQSNLHLDRHLGHLVEKQRAAVGAFEAAAVRPRGAGEAAALVAEQFAFDQILGDRAAIDRDERPVLARERVGAASSRPVPCPSRFHRESSPAPWNATVDRARERGRASVGMRRTADRNARDVFRWISCCRAGRSIDRRVGRILGKISDALKLSKHGPLRCY